MSSQSSQSEDQMSSQADHVPTAGFGPDLKKYFNNKTLSDVVVRCSSQEFAVHKLVLFSHSEYFVKQLSGPWKESQENAIVITEFHADVVEAMLYFLYHLDYKVPTNAMIFNARMYEIADNYGLDSLKNLAKDKFRTAIEADWNEAEYVDAISIVYTSTPPQDHDLRESVVDISMEHMNELIGHGDFKSALEANPEFAIDIIHGQAEKIAEIQNRGYPRYRSATIQVFVPY
ncbi:unnamed protein product [Fusarium venenatum]|uniref:BTB domain-containing protein n=1 Tax=Fusarium venenatum TaxID=56646 RepID=A0A2L2TBV3_9HYPO|nr:uncharacterized protein FVRRES_08541 [Fusarium venenatum]KAH6965310.1 BTB/POZ protein [Fusarium venenatum]CEI68464.1 unnamed protein product [Fusarium venenatum]